MIPSTGPFPPTFFVDGSSYSVHVQAFDKAQNSSAVVASTFTYDVRGNLLTTTSGGLTSTSTYDNADNVLTTTTPGGHTTTNTYDSHSNLLTVSDPLGNVTHNVYDSSGQLISTTDPALTRVAWTAPKIAAENGSVPRKATDEATTASFTQCNARKAGPETFSFEVTPHDAIRKKVAP